MKLPATKILVFNAAALLFATGAVAAVVRSLVFSPTVAPCNERYLSSTAFALERGGVMLAAADLQASLGGKDAGVIDNLAIARVKDAPMPVAIGVSLPKGAAGPPASAAVVGGVSFPWQPRSIQGKTATCLSYSIKLPADFEFSRIGTLPGVQGWDASGQSEDGFAARLSWRGGGTGNATNRVISGGETRAGSVDVEGFNFPRGRWVKFEQEVVLNTPKRSDGVLRIWVDGKLAIDRTDLVFRAKPDVTLSGVAVDVFYGNEEINVTSPKDALVWLTPFELRW